MSYDPLKIQPGYWGWDAYYDPEGPSGHGKTREAALIELIRACDDEIREKLLAGSIVAMGVSPPSREGGLREAATEARDAIGKALNSEALDRRSLSHAKAMLEAALGSVPARGPCFIAANRIDDNCPPGTCSAPAQCQRERKPGGTETSPYVLSPQEEEIMHKALQRALLKQGNAGSGG